MPLNRVARFLLFQDRFFSDHSEGVHALIQDGAKLVRYVEDILEEFPDMAGDQQTMLPMEQDVSRESKAGRAKSHAEPALVLSEDERKVYESLSASPCHLDQIVEKSGAGIHLVLQTLSLLEMQDVVEQMPGQRFRVSC